MSYPNLAELKNEIETDPALRGYAGKTHEEIAKLLSRPDRKADREQVDTGAIIAGITLEQYTAVNDTGREYLQLIATAGSVPNTKELRDNLGALFPLNPSRKNIRDAFRRDGSRLDEIGLPPVNTSIVADALRGT